MFVLNQLSFKIKYQLEFDEGHVDEDTYATNLFTVSVLGIILSFISMHRVTHSRVQWNRVQHHGAQHL